MKIDRKVNWAIGLSITAIVSVVTLILLWVCNVWKFSVIGIETFIGVIVSLLAIIVTFVVGWQIYSTLDLKSIIKEYDVRIKEVEALKNQFMYQQDKIEQLTFMNKHITGLTWGKTAIKEEQWTSAFRYLIISLHSSLLLKSSINIDSIFSRLDVVSENINSKSKVTGKIYEEIVKTNLEITNLDKFQLIKDRYNKMYDNIFSKIEIE